MERSSAVKTPGAIPNKEITTGTIKGKRIAPTNGVNATKERNILIRQE